MATYIQTQTYTPPHEFAEPCGNCFASVTYGRNEPTESVTALGRKSIVCPCCGKEMFVNFYDIALC